MGHREERGGVLVTCIVVLLGRRNGEVVFEDLWPDRRGEAKLGATHDSLTGTKR